MPHLVRMGEIVARPPAPVEKKMEHRRIHGLEKLQVQLAAVASLAVVYFWLWPRFWPWDPQSAVAFLPAGAYAQLAAFAVMVLALAVVVGIVTMSTRAEGALLVVLIGAGGISLHSPQIRALFWAHPDSYTWVYGQLLLESLVMVGILLAAAMVIAAVRAVAARAIPALAYRSPLERLTPEQRERIGSNLADQGRSLGLSPFAWIYNDVIKKVAVDNVVRDIQKDGEQVIARSHWTHAAGCFGLTFLISMVLMFLLMQSADRGQVLFALFASFMVGSLAGHQIMPTRWGGLLPLAPLAAAVFFYAVAAASHVGGSPLAWVNIPKYSQALPIDWLTAGSGGAVVGHWISCRLHELRLMEALEEKKES